VVNAGHPDRTFVFIDAEDDAVFAAVGTTKAFQFIMQGFWKHATDPASAVR